MNECSNGLYGVFASLAQLVKAANYQLDHRCYQEAKNLFLVHFSSGLENLREVVGEFEVLEFLAYLDSEGEQTGAPPGIVDDFQQTVQEYPAFGEWFRVEEGGQDSEPILLIPRWLSHLVGFRHLSIHLFIDLPSPSKLTMIQVRSGSRLESPGCFDLPVAGHRVNLDSIHETLVAELNEETNIEIDALEEMEAIGEYNFSSSSDGSRLLNNEYRVVFRSRLKRIDSLANLKLPLREVAAMSFFSIPELRNIVTVFPERIASGLSASLPLYLRHLEGTTTHTQG
jgi:8-oxo-dGTP pyrophosphatase MutT (NUDIX family)